MSVHTWIKIEEDTGIELFDSFDGQARVSIGDPITFQFHDTAKGRELASLILQACSAIDQQRRDRAAREAPNE